MYVAQRPLTLGTCLTQPDRRTEKQIKPIIKCSANIVSSCGEKEKNYKGTEYKTVNKSWLLKVCTQTREVTKEKFNWL